ncbi:MAG: FAD-dependent oxidoreductase [Steroidobacteraceae bacterium]
MAHRFTGGRFKGCAADNHHTLAACDWVVGAVTALLSGMVNKLCGGGVSGIQTVLIVGGGIGGMSCAIELRKQGLKVDLIDLDPEWRALGAGITITGPTLRAFKYLGVMDEICQHGATWGGAKVFTADGTLVEEMNFPPVEADVPPTGGIMRPLLHKILSTRVTAAGVSVRLGLTVNEIIEGEQQATVVFSDGTHQSYDLVVAADGAFSKMREKLFPDAPKPKFTGQGIYRIVAERPPGFDRSYFYMGSNKKVGFNPVSATHMYMFLLEYSPDNPWLPPEEQPKRLYEQMAGFGGIVPIVRESVLTCGSVNYRPLEAIIQPAPWYKGHCVLLGDAAHATTPHLASGAGMAVEDALVLAEELRKATTLQQALAGYVERRYERCKLIVDNSVKLGELEMAGSDPHVHTKLMSETIAALRKPI